MGLEIVVKKKNGEDYMSFRAGSYSGFHEWRDWLLNLVEPINSKKLLLFEELLFHSDCDGILNQNQCQRLAEDFKSINNDLKMLMKLKNSDEDWDWYISRFEEWKKAIEFVAKNGGNIIFG